MRASVIRTTIGKFVAQPSSIREDAPEVFELMVEGFTIARIGGFGTSLFKALASRQLRRSPATWASLAVLVAQFTWEQAIFRKSDSGETPVFRFAGVADAAFAATHQVLDSRAARQIPETYRWNYEAASFNNALWVVAFAGLNGSAPVASGILAHLPLIVRARKSETARVNLFGVLFGASFLVRGIDILGRMSAATRVERGKALAATIETAAQEANNAMLRAALRPLIEEVHRLAALSERGRLDAVRLESLRLLPLSRAAERPAEELMAAVTLRARPELVDGTAVVRGQLAKLGKIASLGSVCWVSASALSAPSRSGTRWWQSIVATFVVIANAVFRSISSPAVLRGNLRRNHEYLVNVGLGVGTSWLLLTSVQPRSVANLDCAARDNYLLQSAASSADPRDIVKSWLIGSVLAAPYELRRTTRPGLVAQVSHLCSYQLAVPLALQRILAGVWRAHNDATCAASELSISATRRGAELGALAAGVAAHDYCTQTLYAISRQTELTREQICSALRDTEARLNAAVSGKRSRARTEDLIAECIRGYHSLGLLAVTQIGDLPELDSTFEDVVVGAINQGLSNVLTHSPDRHPLVRCSTNSLSGFIHITVENRHADVPSLVIVEGFGLTTLRNKVGLVGGQMTIDVGVDSFTLEVRLMQSKNQPISPGHGGIDGTKADS